MSVKLYLIVSIKIWFCINIHSVHINNNEPKFIKKFNYSLRIQLKKNYVHLEIICLKTSFNVINNFH